VTITLYVLYFFSLYITLLLSIFCYFDHVYWNSGRCHIHNSLWGYFKTDALGARLYVCDRRAQIRCTTSILWKSVDKPLPSTLEPRPVLQF